MTRLFFCCGPFSPFCVVDTIAHAVYLRHSASHDVGPLRGPFRWICDRHDATMIL